GPPLSTVVVSPSILFARLGSYRKGGRLICAVLTNGSGAFVSAVAVITYVNVPPFGMLTVSLILPTPLAVHAAPADGTQLQVGLIKSGGTSSTKVAPMALSGPRLPTTML